MMGDRSAKARGDCGFCGSQIPSSDFKEGRASMVTGRPCCACCLERGEWVGVGALPRGVEAPVCRSKPRFVPAVSLDLQLRLPGWRGVLFGNLAVEWLDVSEEGFRAVVARRCAVGDLLLARIRHRPTRRVHQIVSWVLNVQETKRAEGGVVAGFSFTNATESFRHLLRKIYGAEGLSDERLDDDQSKSKKIG